MLGASNKDNQFRVPVDGPAGTGYVDRSGSVLTRSRARDRRLIVSAGWQLRVAERLAHTGVPAVAPEDDRQRRRAPSTLGFDSAPRATDAVDRLHSTAATHDQIIISSKG